MVISYPDIDEYTLTDSMTRDAWTYRYNLSTDVCTLDSRKRERGARPAGGYLIAGFETMSAGSRRNTIGHRVGIPCDARVDVSVVDSDTSPDDDGHSGIKGPGSSLGRFIAK